jgi:hypothetical protein
MSAVNQLLCANPDLEVRWYGVTWRYRWEFYEALRKLWGAEVEELFLFPPGLRPSEEVSAKEPGEVGRMFQCALPDLYKYRVMTLDSFLAVMEWLEWTDGEHYYNVPQKRNETIFTLPGIEHHVSFSWRDPDLPGVNEDQDQRSSGFTLEQVGTSSPSFYKQF